MHSAADVLDLQLPAQKVKTNVLNKVLQPGQTNAEPIMLFIEALTDVLLGT